MGALRQSRQSSCGDMTGLSQYGPAPCRRDPRGARSRQTGHRRMRRDRRNELWEDHVSARPIRGLAAIALWALATRTADDGGEGSLRWAIERNNAAPGRLRIEVDPAGQAPYVIKLASPLPAIKGPVTIEGAPWKRSGEFVAL